MKNKKYLGKVIDGFLIIRNKDNNNPSNRDVIGKCEKCGNEQVITSYKLKHNLPIKCKGCKNKVRENLSRKNLINLIGMKFGTLTVIEPGPRDTQGSMTWICRCDCGNRVMRRGYQLRSNKAVNGCSNCRKSQGKLLYKSLLDKHNKKEIILCDEWLNDFKSFENWYKENHKYNTCIYCSDKQNVYSPESCTFMDRVSFYNIQNNDKLIQIGDESFNLTEASNKFNIPLTTLKHRYNKGLRGLELVSKDRINPHRNKNNL